MKAHAIFLSVAGILVAAVLFLENSKAQAATQTEQVNRELQLRVEKLEKELDKRKRSSEFTLLRGRVGELERLMREARGGSLTMSPKADLRDVSTLQRDHTTLKRTVMSLESKLGRMELMESSRSTSTISLTSLQREIASVRRAVSRLESTVSRLESR